MPKTKIKNAAAKEPRCARCNDTGRVPGDPEPQPPVPCPRGHTCTECQLSYERAVRRHWPHKTCGACLGLGRGPLTAADRVTEIEERERTEAAIRKRDPQGYRPPPPIEPYPDGAR